MQVALIPPTPDLNVYGHGMFHLLLSHLLHENKYYKHYMIQRDRGAYLVLDNSAHEQGIGDDPEILLFNALALRAQEVVVPDVLDDGPGTVEKAVQALDVWFEGKNKHVIHDLSPSLMYVPQGRNLAEWEQCLSALVRLHLYCAKKYGYRKNFVIGVSKDYDVWPGGTMYLLEAFIVPLVKKLALVGVPVQIHLLGWARDLWALEKVAQKFPEIRSTDSAKPFVYAYNGIDLVDYLDGPPPLYPKRSKDYFRRHVSTRHHAEAISNVRIFKAVASGDRRSL